MREKFKRWVSRIDLAEHGSFVPALAIVLIIVAVAFELSPSVSDASKNEISPAPVAKDSISAKCKNDVVCIWDSINAPHLCKRYFSAAHRHPREWLVNKELNSHAHYQIETKIVTYESDDLLMESGDGLLTLTTYSCDIYIGEKEPEVLRSSHQPGALKGADHV